jgi:uncharacterized protein
MLVRFQVTNFRSLRDAQELSMVASSIKDLPEVVVKRPRIDVGLLPCAAVYGANASGKTNVIRALNYMRGAVVASQTHWKPDGPIFRDPFLLDLESAEAPSTFEVDFLISDVRHRYGFSLNSNEILREWLYAYPSGKRRTWFERDSKQGPIKFGKNLPGENRAIENLTRKNSLFLSSAAQNSHATLSPVYTWFSSNFVFVLRERTVANETAELCLDEQFKRAVSKSVMAADLGIVGLDVKEEDFMDAEGAPEEVKRGVKAFRDVLMSVSQQSPNVKIPSKVRKIALQHRGYGSTPIVFPERNESEGTVAFLGLLGPVLRSLSRGGIICIDELDASLHPLLAMEIVSLFNDPKRNPRGAQIIFTTHDTNLLDTSLLRRDQIWFTEKDQGGATHLYPLTDFKPRKNENLEHGYLQGRYGAVPFIGQADFLTGALGNDA